MSLEPISLEDRIKTGRGQGVKLEDLSISLDFLTPSSSNRDALKSIKSRIAKNKETLDSLYVAEERKLHKPKMNNTFISVFPARDSRVYNLRKNYLAPEVPDHPKKYFHRKADQLSYHREAMIRASNLFKLYPR